MSPFKQYLGDSVYADFDGYSIVLTTENDERAPSNTIVIEPTVFEALLRYREWSKAKAQYLAVNQKQETV